MEFDKSRVFTSVNADELKDGSKVIVADSIYELKKKVSSSSSNQYIVMLDRVNSDNFDKRFRVQTYSACHLEDNDIYTDYNLAYLISEPEEKKLEWTDLKIGDIITNGERSYLVTGIDKKGECGSHIYCGNDWITDGELNNWKKVE